MSNYNYNKIISIVIASAIVVCLFGYILKILNRRKKEEEERIRKEEERLAKIDELTKEKIIAEKHKKKYHIIHQCLVQEVNKWVRVIFRCSIVVYVLFMILIWFFVPKIDIFLLLKLNGLLVFIFTVISLFIYMQARKFSELIKEWITMIIEKRYFEKRKRTKEYFPEKSSFEKNRILEIDNRLKELEGA